MAFQDKTDSLEFKKRLRKYIDDTSPTNPNPILKASNSTSFRLFLAYMGPLVMVMLTAMLAVALASIIDGFLIYRLKFIVNGGIDTDNLAKLAQNPTAVDAKAFLDPNALADFAVILVVLMFIRSGLQFFSNFTFNYTSAKLAVNMGQKVFKQIALMPQAFFDVHGHGKIISKVQYEVNTMAMSAGQTLLSITRDGSTVLAFLFVMFQAN